MALKQKKAEDSFYQKLSDDFDVNVLVAGDSIGAGAGTETDGQQWFKQLQAYLRNEVNETLLFFVLSYFWGLIFQEAGSLIQKIFTHKNNRLLKAALKTENNSHIYLTDVEKIGVYSYIIKKLELDPNEDNDNVVYNYCKFSIIENGDTTRMDKDQSISAMARSLSLYFTLLAFGVLIMQ